MRLWHVDLIPHLPCYRTTGDRRKNQLLGQHRECCGMRGDGWGNKHETVDYVFAHPYGCLYQYHASVMREMQARGYNVNLLWFRPTYRGKTLGTDVSLFTHAYGYRYPEHNDAYMQECLDNLRSKGIRIEL